jgi:hypothetical protein
MELNLTELGIASITAVATEVVTTTDGMSAGDGAYTEDGMMNTEIGVASAKDPLLSSWPFVIGISAAVLLVSVALGILLAKRKIKKGIELYED